MKSIKPLLMAFICTLALAGCGSRTARIVNVDTPLAVHYSADHVKQAILQAGMARQWVMTPVQPGVINGSLKARDHQANIQITYSPDSYSIHYVSSKNLLADTKGNIHRNYNHWIANLNKDIQIRLINTAN
ncbi:hypothetical protein SJI19_05575 [Acerihabitans sp. TG2]|uniref:hypothetical protein n=1 Tax=Acerihabitans sp. TG2 TaxID=3096008 RepID=UPI002B22A6BD|nr:hypothetical protein [Acerihabitans sp. TG2]MEA9390025.1 hypothetical protein [Acerihabitans sp. TG2]